MRMRKETGLSAFLRGLYYSRSALPAILDFWLNSV